MHPTIEETVSQLIEANLRGLKIAHIAGIVRTRGLNDYYIRISSPEQEMPYITIFKYRIYKTKYLSSIINLYEAIDIVKEHWDDRFTDIDWKGSV
jgi:hypothetical protein